MLLKGNGIGDPSEIARRVAASGVVLLGQAADDRDDRRGVGRVPSCLYHSDPLSKYL